MKERLRNTEFDGLKQSQSDVLLGPILGQAIGDDDGKLVQHQDNVPAAISLFIQIHIHKQFGIYVYGTSLEKRQKLCSVPAPGMDVCVCSSGSTQSTKISRYSIPSLMITGRATTNSKPNNGRATQPVVDLEVRKV